jgi:hypothetical protein
MGKIDDVDGILEIPDEILEKISFTMPWQYADASSGMRDEDGFSLQALSGTKDDSKITRDTLQEECWQKFHRNPQVNTSVRGLMGRLTGLGFETTSENQQIQEVIEETELDPRNRLYHFWPKFVGRSNVEGELFLNCTVHLDGFIEVDFIDPANIADNGDDDSGIIFHPDKPTMPLFYNIVKNGKPTAQIPSIFVARYPELISLAKKHDDWDTKLQRGCKSRKHKYRVFKGYYRFIIAWDKSLITRRAVSYLRTTLEWLNHYENLKKYEIDHKKSSGSYMWVFRFTDARMFKLWLTLSDEDRRKTGIASKKTPGGTLVLPPGVEVECKNPQLTSIREQDTDILQMVSSGMNEPDDVMTGTSKGTFASVKASRGPMSDRTSDEIAYFDRFLKYDFWSGIFFLKSKIADFPSVFSVREAYMFANQKPKFKEFKRRPEQLVDISYPSSEVIDFEARAKGLLGVKHGPVAETVGLPNTEVARRLGIGSYGRQRLRKATEDDRYPKLEYEMGVDAESLQEKKEGEPGKPSTSKTPDKKE